MRKYLRHSREIQSRFDKKVVRQFAMDYLREDGCFLLRIVGKNSTDIILSDLMLVLWVLFNAGSMKPKKLNKLEEETNIDPTTIDELLKENEPSDRINGMARSFNDDLS